MNLPVVFGHKGGHVVGSSVRHFQSISIANLIKLVIFVKAFLDNLEKHSTNICFHIQREGWIQPCDSPRVKTGYLDSRGLGQTTQQYNLQSC